AFSILDMSDEEVNAFADAIRAAKKDVHQCPVCGNLTDSDICSVCQDESRDRSIICVVEDARDVTALERVREYTGLYHVLGGAISPLRGKGPEDLSVGALIDRIKNGGVQEVIIATNPTVEGETTAMYIARLLRPLGVKTSRLAYGVPVGGDLEYADEVTLNRALEGRREIT
ncbi:MAG: recombination mediator RecR, partial [Eubacteriales bacterium]